jgi:alginate O-acetyltransferase complex protein AlgI
MLFSSPFFLFYFLPITVLAYYLTRDNWKNAILLIFSAFFYYWGESAFVLVVVVSSLVDHKICLFIYDNKISKKGAAALYLGVTLNVLILFYFKYIDFSIENINILVNSFGYKTYDLLNIGLPIGISFIVFEKITYLVDIYRGVGKPARTYSDYLLYVFFFPKLLAGPIIKYHEIKDQLISRQHSYSEFFSGFQRFQIGLIKKVFIADTVSEVSDIAFNLPFDQVGFLGAWLGIICFTLQIYFDFSGYSDMAIGMGRMFGFKLNENFNNPYISESFTEFWRRWHISLSTWIREYLYFSLGGNRKGNTRTYINLWLCFLLSGLWHGASWNFILWGIYNGMIIVLDKLFFLRLIERTPRLFNIAINLFLIVIGWLIFRSNSFDQFCTIFSAMFNPLITGKMIYISNDVLVAMICGIFWSLFPGSKKYVSFTKGLQTNTIWQVLISVMISIISILALTKVVAVTFNPFLYFRF